MSEFTRDEVETAFRHYFRVGQVLEDWEAWSDLFTDDAVYHDHFYGKFTGPSEIRRFIEGTMGAAPHVYNPLAWYAIDGDRVVYEVINRADNPEPGAPPIDFSSWQNIRYAGNRKWRSEEDLWLMAEMKRCRREYVAARAKFPQSTDDRLSRLDWGDSPEWAHPADAPAARPSWLARPHFRPFRGLSDIDFGERTH